MAEVLAPIQQTGSMTILHTSTDPYQNNTSQSHSQPSRSAQMPRTHYNNHNGGTGYRGTSAAPISPYAFQQTPQLQHRTASAGSVPYSQIHLQAQSGAAQAWRSNHASSSSDSTNSTVSSNRSHIKKEDALRKAGEDPTKRTLDTRPVSGISFSTSVPDLSLTSPGDATVKPSPDRYRRTVRRTESGTGTPSVQTPPATQQNATSYMNAPSLQPINLDGPPTVRPVHQRTSSVDDLHVPKQGTEQAKRYRRRSLSGMEAEAAAKPAQSNAQSAATLAQSPSKRPMPNETRTSSTSGSSPTHQRTGSSGSATSHRPSSQSSNRPSSRQGSNVSATTTQTARSDGRTITVPPRGSSDASKRLGTPSPLSKLSSEAEPEANTPTTPTQPAPSTAAQHLAAINERNADKGMKSRLRRAFSFGSAAELRRATAENNMTTERAKLRKDQPEDELSTEDARIAAKQEAAGIGAGIYSGQGGFTGSTDNLSISSTASSASIMLRKMGKGMKKGGRSIKGLFRPKSVIGVPAADGPIVQPSMAQVSMVTVEAGKVNVNADPREHVGGGTGYPKLERNSLDVSTVTDSQRPTSARNQVSQTDSTTRKSIVGGERERAEVLAAVRKGILKRSGTNSPVIRPIDGSDTPTSSTPSTPKDNPAQLALEGTDYFIGNGPRFANASSKSLPTTPHGSRNISFSPRLQFHDAWSSTEYDRRGDIATCNRLTPVLAQQIKEELNTFKMEMEVHELSKPHTHFF